MADWTEKRLIEFVDDLVMGQSPDSKTYNTNNIGLPFIQGNADMSDGYPKIRQHTTDPRKISELNDILISVRAPVGDIFQNNVGKLAIGRGLSAIRIKDKSLRFFVFHFFNWNKIQFLKLEQGTTFTEIGKREVRNLKLLLPKSKPEQTAIAGILSKVDEVINATKKSIKAAEKLKKALKQNLFTGKLKSDGTWRSENEFYIDEKIGKVPIGWEIKKLGEIGNFLNGVNFSKNQLGTGYPFINLNDIYRNKIIDNSKLDRVNLKPNSKLILKNGDIVFVRSSVKPSGIGMVSLFKTDKEPIIFCGFIIKYSYSQETIIPEYIIELLLSDLIRQKIIALGQVVANTNINQRALKGLRIIFPKDTNEQKEIANKFEIVDNQIVQKQEKIKTLERLKKSLMQNLLTGKKRVDVGKINQLLKVN